MQRECAIMESNIKEDQVPFFIFFLSFSTYRLILGLFFLFTVLHLFANYKAVRSVVMETLNEARLSIILQEFLKDGQILSPLEANQREPVFMGGNGEPAVKYVFKKSTS